MKNLSFNCRMVRRSQGGNAVKKAAYIGGRKILDEKTQKKFNYNQKSSEVTYSKIMAPTNSPDWVYNPGILWNKVEEREQRKDAQVARELIIALPVELPHDKQIELIEKYLNKYFSLL